MKPFNLEEAKAGKPVVNGEGFPVRILAFDNSGREHSIYGVVKRSCGRELIKSYTNKGMFFDNEHPSVFDLYMKEEAEI